MTHTETLRRYFGYEDFRPGQEPVVLCLLSGRDVLAVMPTGAGKSICYQVPCLMLPGITVVVSPLISLMQDQVAALVDRHIPAAYINSSLNDKQVKLALRRAAEGAYKIIYVAPERLNTYRFLEYAKKETISLVAVDEAHCISHWGPDFRPAYLKIKDFIDSMPVRPVVAALTATATPEVRRDISTKLGLLNPFGITTGFDRKNLTFAVRKPRNKYTALIKYLNTRPDQCGIIYCGTRRNVDELTDRLNAAGFSAVSYHAGMKPEERSANQYDFIYGRKRIAVATNAFGMGIDKPDVRFVIHFNMPKDLESYYQEAGRAGRDGLPSDCILYYGRDDVRLNEYLIDSKSGEHLQPKERRQIRKRELYRLKQMKRYAKTRRCLRGRILAYFGEESPKRCGNCSRCDNSK